MLRGVMTTRYDTNVLRAKKTARLNSNQIATSTRRDAARPYYRRVASAFFTRRGVYWFADELTTAADGFGQKFGNWTCLEYLSPRVVSAVWTHVARVGCRPMWWWPLTSDLSNSIANETWRVMLCVSKNWADFRLLFSPTCIPVHQSIFETTLLTSLVTITVIGWTAENIANWVATGDECVHFADATWLDFVIEKFV